MSLIDSSLKEYLKSLSESATKAAMVICIVFILFPKRHIRQFCLANLTEIQK